MSRIVDSDGNFSDTRRCDRRGRFYSDHNNSDTPGIIPPVYLWVFTFLRHVRPDRERGSRLGDRFHGGPPTRRERRLPLPCRRSDSPVPSLRPDHPGRPGSSPPIGAGHGPGGRVLASPAVRTMRVNSPTVGSTFGAARRTTQRQLRARPSAGRPRWNPGSASARRVRSRGTAARGGRHGGGGRTASPGR